MPCRCAYAVAVNSVSSIMLNKLDILSGLDEICLCVAYEIDGRRVEAWTSSAEQLAGATPIYERFPGWTRADPPGSDPGRAARERPTLRERPGDRGRRPDRARIGRARANPDDRAGVSADAPSSGPGAGPQPRRRPAVPGWPALSALLMPTRILDRWRRRPRARPGLEAGRPSPGSTRSSWRPAVPRSAASRG